MIIMTSIMKCKDLMIESLKDNKKLIIGLYIGFIIVFIAAWMLSANPIADALPEIQNLSHNATNTTEISQEGPVELFTHNAGTGIRDYITSVFFAIPAIVSLFYNAINLGVMGQLFASLMPKGGLQYIIYLIPHGIFEITGTVIQSAAGILLFGFIVKFIRAWISKETDGISDAFDKTKKVLIQSLVLLAFATVLMLIAAPIEAYFSVPFSDFIIGLL